MRWMVELYCNRHNDEWIAEHTTDLQKAVREALFTPHLRRDAVIMLKILGPYFTTHHQWRQWLPLLMDALVMAQQMHDNDEQTWFWRSIASLFAFEGQHAMANRALYSALFYADISDTPSAILRAYIGLIRLQMIHQDESFNDEFVRQVHEYAVQVNQPSLWAELHQALAMAYVYRGDTLRALSYAQTAFAYWRTTRQILETARIAYTLAQIYRQLRLFTLADYYLQISQDEYNKKRVSVAAVYYEKALLMMDQKDPTEAIHWLKKALQGFKYLDAKKQEAAVYHAMGLAYLEKRMYTHSLNNLTNARKRWEELDNSLEIAKSYHALSTLEWRIGSPSRAVDHAQTTLQIARDLPESYERDYLIKAAEHRLVEARKLV
jgi:tetratricopeptide (TPR) repeat protein